MDTKVLSLSLKNAIGMSISVTANDSNDLYRKMREFGASGWVSGDPPDGGFVLPYAMADVFDWSLIGARGFMIDADTHAVERLGLVYKRRLFAESKPKKMPAKIVYSRGARSEERDETKEQKDDYVWLIQFVGGGRVIGELAVRHQKTDAATGSRPGGLGVGGSLTVAAMAAPGVSPSMRTEPGTITKDQGERISDAWATAHPGVRERALTRAMLLTTANLKRTVEKRAELSEAEAELLIQKFVELIEQLERERTS